MPGKAFQTGRTPEITGGHRVKSVGVSNMRGTERLQVFVCVITGMVTEVFKLRNSIIVFVLQEGYLVAGRELTGRKRSLEVETN